jgi:putative flippase GtrA
MSVFGLSAVKANVAGFAAGFLSSFFLNRSFTFRSKVALLPGLAWFLAVVICGYAANMLTLLVATQWLGINPYLAQFMGVGMYVVLVFVGSERFVYRSGSQ